MNYPVALWLDDVSPPVSSAVAPRKLTPFFDSPVPGLFEESYAPGFVQAEVRLSDDVFDAAHLWTPSELDEQAARTIARLPLASIQRTYIGNDASPLTQFEPSNSLVTTFRSSVNGAGLDYLIKWIAGSHISIPAAREELADAVEDAFIFCIAYRALPKRNLVLLNEEDTYLFQNALQERLSRLDQDKQEAIARALLDEVKKTVTSPRHLLIDGASVTYLNGAFCATLHRQGDVHLLSKQFSDSNPTDLLTGT